MNWRMGPGREGLPFSFSKTPKMERRRWMTREKEKEYEETDSLRRILNETLRGKKFVLDCGHHVTFGHFLGSDVVLLNGDRARIICTLCAY
jgi:hypothetical protein